MRRAEKRLFFGVLAVLAAALILLVIQWMGGSDSPTIYHLSVLLDGGDSEYSENFRAGLNQAALERNVDLRILSRYDETSTQTDVLAREWAGESDGVVILPVNREEVTRALESAPNHLAVTVVGPRLESERVNCHITLDYAEQGRLLAQAVEKTGERTCTIVTRPSGTAPSRELLNDLEAELKSLNIDVQRVEGELEELTVPAAGALVGVEPAVTQALCKLPGAQGRVCGVGVSGELLYQLEEGTAAGLVAASDFNAGYQAVIQTVNKLEGKTPRDQTVESYAAAADTMFTEPLIHILFAAP